jgi:tetratricopeptide (TPR) repeat protein
VLPLRAVSGERSWVLVADFDAPRGEASLGTAVRELVTAGLNQATNLSVVPQEQVTMARREASIPDTAALETGLARELAFRSSVRIIVNGSVQRVGPDGYGLVLNAVDAESGENRFSRSTFTTDRGDALVSAIATLVRRLREELGERREVVEATRPLMRARTPSFAAFRSYADAISVMRAGAYDRSNILLQDAVAVDTAFATAWAAMAMNYVTARRLDSASIAFAHAAAHPDRLGDADLHRLRGDMAFNIDRDLERAVAWYHRFLAESPTSVGGHNNLGLYLSALGRHEEALAEFQTAATIDPLRKGPRQIQLMNIAAELVIVGKVDSARGVARKLRGAPAQYLELMLLNAEDRWDSLATVATAIKDAPGTERFVRLPAQTHAVGTMAARGAIDAATGELLRLAASSTGADQRWYLHALLLLDLVLERRPTWALPAAISADTSAGAVLLRGVRFALRGDIVAARREARVLESRKSVRRSVGSGPAYLGALIEAERGAWPAVRSLLSVDAAKGEHDPFSLDRVSSLSMRWLVAQSFARAGALDSAITMLEAVARPTAIPPAHYPLRGFVVPFAHRQLAIWYALLGRQAEAARHRQAFTRGFVVPDASGSAILRFE